MWLALLLTLQTVTVDRQPPAAPAWPVQWIATHCPEFEGIAGTVAIASCRVSESGEFATFGSDTYYYALYCVEQKEFDDGGSCNDDGSTNSRLYSAANAAVFVQRGGIGPVRLVLSMINGAGHFNRPRIGENAQGAIMELPYVGAATCECNGSTYYIWRAPTRMWQQMDWESWKEELHRKLPSNLSTWGDGEFWPDLRTLTAESPLWRRDDCHACASGGSVSVQLEIVDNRFVLKSLTIRPEQTPR